LGCGCWFNDTGEKVSKSRFPLAAGHGCEMVLGRKWFMDPQYERCTRNYIITWLKLGLDVVERS
jgi:hypothetical protein